MSKEPAVFALSKHVPDAALLKRTGRPLPEWISAVVGKTVQIRIPMRDAIDLRRVATVLRTLANRLEVLSHSRAETGTIMLLAWEAARTAQGQLSRQHSDDGNNA